MSWNEEVEKNNETEGQGQGSGEGCEPMDQGEEAALERDSIPNTGQMAGELSELKGRLQRLGADYQNYQRRAGRQAEQAQQLAQEDLVRSLLVALDNFEHTLKKGQEAQDVAAVLEGVQMVYDHFLDILRSFGMQRIDVAPGVPFDPNLHEAMLHELSEEYEEQTVVRELSPGYAMNGRTLRPVKVAVAKRPARGTGQETEAEGSGSDRQENEE